MDTKKKENLKYQHCCQCWSPRYWVSVLSTRCGGCHPKGLIVHCCQLIQDKTIINKNFNKNNNKNSTSITFIWQCHCPFFFFFFFFFWKNRKPEKYVWLISRILPLILSQSYWHDNHNNKKNLSCWRDCFSPNPDTNAFSMIFWKNS